MILRRSLTDYWTWVRLSVQCVGRTMFSHLVAVCLLSCVVAALDDDGGGGVLSLCLTLVVEATRLSTATNVVAQVTTHLPSSGVVVVVSQVDLAPGMDTSLVV